MIIPSPHLVVAVAKSLSSYQPVVGKFYGYGALGMGHGALGMGHFTNDK
ncbi:hypothetical protein [Nostoc sp. NMS4]|nr:hypothetical protein [Nostoc sp. NMS4]MBN3925937.1 hypothetical protein [Nostoc sp. NMS4]